MRTTSLTRIAAAAASLVIGVATAVTLGPVAASAATPTTAWNGSSFQTDPAGILSRSDIVLGSAPVKDTQSMPLGNGTLGAAVWDENGLTAQLNRVDTMPDRKSPARLVIPGLDKLTSAPDYSGRLSLYDATLTQHGGGMTATTFVRADKDELVVDVTGADPDTTQSAELELWKGRTPDADAGDGVADLAETWKDERGQGATGKTFGTLAGITAGGRDVTASVVDPLTVKVSFKPKADGSFRIVVAAPHYAGSSDPLKTATDALGGDASASTASVTTPHLDWWHHFWSTIGLIRLDSADGHAQYIENLRDVALYAEASEERGDTMPGSNAGQADLFDYSEGDFKWDASAYWHWNLRSQVANLMSAGAPELDDAYFDLYRNDLDAIETWTKNHMGGRDGICIPETMRFSGQGYENETWLDSPGLNCDDSPGGYYNKRTITTGAEVALNVWNRYLYTGDEAFLKENYPLMKQAAIFLTEYAKVGDDGKLHTYPSNAHETQWDVHDPTTDIAAMKALFPVVITAAKHLGLADDTDADSTLMATLQSDLGKLMPFNTKTVNGTTVIADSYDTGAGIENSENIGLEPVWPYGLIGDDDGAETTLARDTYTDRPNVYSNDWSFDAVQAARLGMRKQTEDALVQLTEKYQTFASGLGNLYGSFDTGPYIEQAAAVANGVQEALVQDYDGTLRIAPALPDDWTASGTVFIPGGKVDVQATGGDVTTAVIEASRATDMTIRNPWKGQSVHVLAVSGGHASEVVAPTTADTFGLTTVAGTDYVVERTAQPTSSMTVQAVSGTSPSQARTLGSRTLGIPGPPAPVASLADAYNNIGITDDAHTAGGNIDGGGGASFSLQALAAVGAKSGGTVTHDGLTFTWPESGEGQNDNVISAGQRISVGKNASKLGFLLTGTYGPITGAQGTVTYTDGTTKTFTLADVPDWSAVVPDGADAVLSPAYEDRAGNQTYDHAGHIYYQSVDLDPTKTVATVTLPDVSAPTPAPVPMLHIFSMAFDVVQPPASSDPHFTVTVDGHAVTSFTVGEKTPVTVSGVAAGSTVALTLHSADIDLGTADANASGVAVVDVTVPAGTDPGSHDLIVTGTDADGVTGSQSFPVTVAAATTPGGGSGSGDTGSGSGDTGSGSGSNGTGSGSGSNGTGSGDSGSGGGSNGGGSGGSGSNGTGNGGAAGGSTGSASGGAGSGHAAPAGDAAASHATGLARTGTDAAGWAALGLLLTAAGAVVLWSRRRTKPRH